jgi:hypothetical protein
VPDSDGIWDKINYQVLQDKNKSSSRKKRMNALLKRSQSILKGFPYAGNFYAFLMFCFFALYRVRLTTLN